MKTLRGLIIGISVLIPAIITMLYILPRPETGLDLSFLPFLNACINSTCTFVLITGGVAIKRGFWKVHRGMMLTAVLLSILFLISYVSYHATHEPTSYGGSGLDATIYYIILISHIILAAAIVPMVLISLYRAYRKDFEGHRRIARWTLPIWLYVTITGVLVYLMISPYY
jgi:putative membrane protein